MTGLAAREHSIFINAFSYTLSVGVVNRLVEADESIDLLIVAAGVSVAAWSCDRLAHELAQQAVHIEGSALEGPVRLINFLTSTAAALLIQFISTCVGRWCLLLPTNEASFATSAAIAFVGVCLLWLLDAAMHAQRPKVT